jgi:hypothetical protein
VQTILVSVISGSVTSIIVAFFLNQKLEKFKAELDLASKEHANRRRLYDELSTLMEDLFGDIPKDADQSLEVNKLFGKLALYAPDEVYIALKEALIDQGVLYGRDVKPKVYCALRRSLFGEKTKLETQDFVPHIKAKHIPQNEHK